LAPAIRKMQVLPKRGLAGYAVRLHRPAAWTIRSRGPNSRKTMGKSRSTPASTTWVEITRHGLVGTGRSASALPAMGGMEQSGEMECLFVTERFVEVNRQALRVGYDKHGFVIDDFPAPNRQPLAYRPRGRNRRRTRLSPRNRAGTSRTISVGAGSFFVERRISR